MIILKIIAGLMLIYFVIKLFMWLGEGTVDLDSDIGESSGGFFDGFFGGDGGDGGGGD